MITKEQTPPGFKLLQTIRSHSAHARYLITLDELDGKGEMVGYLAECQLEGIPSPYSYSASRMLFRDLEGRKVIVRETSHRCYQVFEVSPQMLTFESDDAAMKSNLTAVSNRSETP